MTESQEKPPGRQAGKRETRRRRPTRGTGIAGIHVVRPDGTELDIMELAHALADAWATEAGLKFQLRLGRRLRVAPWHITEIINRLVIAGGLSSK